MFIRLAILLLLTIGSTLVHGHLTCRWGLPAEFQEYAEVVRAIPKQLGSWNFVNDARPMSDGVIEELGVTEYVSRVYSNGNESVTLLMMTGKTGRLVRHTPDICYGASGNTFLKEPTPVTLDVDGQSHEFRVLPIRPASDLSGDFVVVYGFAHVGKFQSPANPRLTYHGQPAVEKIQVLCTPNPDVDKLGEIPESAKSFIAEVCHYIQQAQGSK
jgi:hypothetical protein